MSAVHISSLSFSWFQNVVINPKLLDDLEVIVKEKEKKKTLCLLPWIFKLQQVQAMYVSRNAFAHSLPVDNWILMCGI